MSDLYLILRRRLETVASEWVDVGFDVMHAARKERGLSYEAIARQVPVASKTWERWEKAGRVPVAFIEKVAEILDLEIERPAFHRRLVVVPDRSAESGLSRDADKRWQHDLRDDIRLGFNEQARRLERIEQELRSLRAHDRTSGSR